MVLPPLIGVIEQRYPQSHQAAQAVPKRRLSDEGVFLAIQDAWKKWTMPIHNWKAALNRFIIEFGDRISEHL